MGELESRTPDQSVNQEAVILRGAGLTLVGTVLGGGLAFLNEILLARFLGASSYGLFALAYVITRIAHGVSLFGLGATVLHFLPIFRSQGRTDRVVGTIFASLLLPLLVGPTSTALLWLSAPWVATILFHKPDVEPYIRVLAFAVPLMALSEILALITRAFGYSAYYVLISNVTPPSMIFLSLLMLTSFNAAAAWVPGAIVMAYGVALVLGALCVLKIVGRDFGRATPEFGYREIYGYAFPVLVGTLLYLVMEWADILLLGCFVSPVQVGVYRACVQVVVVFDMIIFPVNAATAHIFPVLEEQSRHAERNRTYRLVTLIVAVLSVPVFFLITLYSHSILSLLGNGFTDGAVVLVILATGRLVRNGLGSAAFLLILSGRQRVETRNAAAAGLANLALNGVLIPLGGILGAAVATSAAEVALNLLRTRQTRRLMGVLPSWLMLLRVLFVGFVVALAVRAVEFLTGIDAKAQPGPLIMRGLGSAVSFAIALWFFGVTRADRSFFKGVFS
jgi:O-antigen/teichoic acid export membrane protein